jgi:probable HAF family extracellular repeat protein
MFGKSRALSAIAVQIIGAAVVTVVTATADSLPDIYLVTSIGVLPGGGSSRGSGLNGAGDVVGSATDPNNGYNNRAVLYADDTLTNLGMADVPYAISSEAVAINADGKIVGDTQNGVPHAFLYDGSGFHSLDTIPNTFSSEPHAVNSSTQIAGTVGILINGNTVLYHAFRSDGQTMTDLTVQLGNPDYSEAFGINDAGQIVGIRRADGLNSHAFLLDAAGPVDLGTLGGLNSSALAINNGGQVVGYSYLPGNGSTTHPFLYTDGQMLDLGLIPDAINGYASAINSAGVVVGTMRLPGYSQNTRAFVYADGGLHNLNDLLLPNTGWLLKAASGVNDSGEIAGWGTLNGAIRGFVLRPSSHGDANCDGVVSFGDINPFVLALTNPAGYQAAFPDCNLLIADMNDNGFVDFGDINAFVSLLSGGG